MKFENTDTTAEAAKAAAEAAEKSAELGASQFQNPIYREPRDIMPKIRFTTDANEAAENQRIREEGNYTPFNIPDTVVYVKPREQTEAKKEVLPVNTEFQNTRYDIHVSALPHDTEASAATGDYAGPSPDSIERKIESAQKSLDRAKENLDWAIEHNTGVMTAMKTVESAQGELDAVMRLYSEALGSKPGADAADAAAEQSDDAMLGSVSHAQWELERAYKSGSRTAIETAKRHLAHEKAKEDVKKMNG